MAINSKHRLETLIKKTKSLIQHGGKRHEILSSLNKIQREYPFDPWAFIEQAYSALKKRNRNYAEAAQIAELGLKTNPDNIRLKLSLAESLSHLIGEHNRAEELFKELINRLEGKDKIKCLSTYADFFVRRGHAKQAQEIYHSILRKSPKDSYARIALARSFRIDNNHSECLKCLENQPLNDDPYWLREKAHCFIELGDDKNATVYLKSARKIGNKKLYGGKKMAFLRKLIPLEKSNQALQGKWQESVLWAAQQPYTGEIVNVWDSVKRLLLSKNEIESGIKYFIRILEEDPTNLAVALQIDRLFTEETRPQERMDEILKQLLKIAPLNLNVLAMVARNYQDKNIDLAEKSWSKFWEVARQIPESSILLRSINHSVISNSLFFRKLGRYQDAYFVIEEARSHWGVTSWELDLERAINLLQLGSYPEAYDILKMLNRAREENPVVLDQMGACLRITGELDEARDIYQRKVDLYPDDVFGWQGLGKTLFDLGDHKGAFKAFKKILEINPDDIDSKLLIAQIYQTNGKYENAKKILIDIDTLSLIKRGWGQLTLENKIADLERQRLEQLSELEESKKLSYLGTMATATAHELNQPIGIIRAITDSALLDLKEGYFKQQDVKRLFERIYDQTERLSAIIESFRRFARGDRTYREKVSLNVLVERATANFLEQFRHRNIRFHTKLWMKKPLPVAWANLFQLEEVLINLLTNARDAVERKKNGVVWVSTWRRKGGSTGFSVEDNGPGLPEAYRKNMFVPFFSTKTSEKGTGLGLYISRRIIDNLGGQLRYQDRRVGGALFTVSLPPLKG